MSAYVAQNIGAGQPQRARKGMYYGMATSFCLGLVMSYFAFFHGAALSRIFARDTAVILASAEYLKGYAIDTLLVSFLFCFIGYFNGCGCTTFVMIQGLIGAFGVRIPVSWLASQAEEVSLFHIARPVPPWSRLSCASGSLNGATHGFKKKQYFLQKILEFPDEICYNIRGVPDK